MSDGVTKDSLQIARLEEQFAAMRSSMQEMAESMRAMRAELAVVKTDMEQARGGCACSC